MYIGLSESNAPIFISLLPDKVSKYNEIKRKICNFVLNLIVACNVSPVPYTTASAEQVFRNRKCRLLQAVLETISS
jgi:hypothetical protein